MKRFFLIGILGGVILGGALYFLWRVIEALVQVVQDWRYGKELEQIAQDAAARRAAQRAADQDPEQAIDGVAVPAEPSVVPRASGGELNEQR